MSVEPMRACTYCTVESRAMLVRKAIAEAKLLRTFILSQPGSPSMQQHNMGMAEPS